MQKKIKTGFEKITDEGLVNFNSSDVRDGDRIVAESSLRLKKAISTFNKKASKETKEMTNLTKFIASLTIVMLIGVGIQIGFLVYQIFFSSPQTS